MALHFEGTQQIKASQEKVWQFVLDPNKVADCAPGFKSMEILGDDHFKPTIAVGIGSVKATFTLDVRLEDVQPQTHAAMSGRGNAAGSAVDMKAAMDLTPVSADETTMAWTADVNVNGAIASVGARLMEGTARKLTAQFFDCFRQKLEAPEQAEAAGETTTEASTSEESTSEAQTPGT